MRKLLPNGLTPAQDRFCTLLARGIPQIQAYRQAGFAKRAKDETAAPKACLLAKQPKVQARIAELLKASGVADLDSVGQAYSDLLRVMTKAEAEGNMTAYAALSRQRLQVLGMLRDNVSLTVENSSSDSDLIQRLAAGDPAMALQLERLVGSKGFVQ